ncbi:mms19 nucleotide excision repair [Quaeritorhiza haematococci]|nr:mms19 nucleotide excision repair [Quaeritorhiza haematococci]
MPETGVGFLATVLGKIRHEFMTKNTGSVLLGFFLEKLYDQASVAELLRGIVAILNMDAVSKPEMLTIAKRMVYQVFACHGFQQWGNEFVFGFITAMDGEKDPRNLFMAFKIAKTIAANFDLMKHAEDLFDVVFCYFPITFRPPPEDIYGITAEDLKNGLRECLVASPAFAPFALPLLIEKLSSSSVNAKRDAMDVIATCAFVYGSEAILPHASNLWDYLKMEVLQSGEQQSQDIGLKALHEITRTLSAAVTSTKGNPLESFLDMVLKECLSNLEEPGHKLAKPSGQILHTCASASDPACHFIIKGAAPDLINKCKQTGSAMDRKVWLQVLKGFIDSTHKVYGTIDQMQTGLDEDAQNPILPFKNDLFSLFRLASVEVSNVASMRAAGVEGLFELVKSAQVLSTQEVQTTVEHLTQILLVDREEVVFNQTIVALVALARSHAHLIEKHTLPILFDKLPANDSSGEGVSIFKAIEGFAVEDDLFPYIVSTLLTKLRGCAKIQDSAETATTQFCHELLSTILSMFIARVELQKDAKQTSTVAFDVLTILKDACVEAALQVNVLSVVLTPKLVNILGKIFTLLTGLLEASAEQKLVVDVFNLIYEGRTSVETENNGQSFRPLHADSPDRITNLSVMFAGTIGCMSNLNMLPVTDIKALLVDLISRAGSTKSDILLGSVAQSMASIVNKWNDDANLESFVREFALMQLMSQISGNANQIQLRQNLLQIFIWITKGLVVRAHPLGYEMTLQLLNLLHQSELAKSAASGFALIMRDKGDDPFSKLTFSKIFPNKKLLFRQRFFYVCVGPLVGQFRDQSVENKYGYLCAMSYLLQHVPTQVLINESQKVMPLLLESMGMSDPDLSFSTVDTLKVMLKNVPTVVEEHVSSIIPSLLGLSIGTASQSRTMRVRIAALECIGLMPSHLKYETLHPFKPKVLKDVGMALDDPKRSVRYAASNARNKWFLFLPASKQ